MLKSAKVTAEQLNEAKSLQFDPNGGIYAVIGLLFVGTVTISLSLAIARSELSERVLRFALWPASIVTGAMLVALVAIRIEAALLITYAPHLFGLGMNIGVGDLVMGAAIIWAALGLWRGFHARKLITG
jgi:hypothetical protein